MSKNNWKFDFTDFQLDGQPEAHNAEFLLSENLGDDYIQLVSLKDQRSSIEDPIESLRSRGENLFFEHKDKISAFITDILLQRYPN